MCTWNRRITDGFNIEALNERYNDIFERYDYIVGDSAMRNYVWKAVSLLKHSHKLRPDRDIDITLNIYWIL